MLPLILLAICGLRVLPHQPSYKDGQTHTVWVWGIDLIDPANNNILLPGSPKTFNISPAVPPTASFLLTSGSQSARNGQTLTLQASQSAPAAVLFDASSSTASSGKTIVNWLWTSNSSIIGTTKAFPAIFPVGTYSISLVVTDSQGLKSAAAIGTIIVQAQAGPPSSYSLLDLNVPAGSSAQDINDSGQVALFNNGRSYLFSGGVSTDIGTLGGSQTIARAINDSGMIVGNSITSSGLTHAFLYSGGAISATT